MCLSDGFGPVFVILAVLSIQNSLAGPAAAGARGQHVAACPAGTLVESYLTSPGMLSPGSLIGTIQN
jgi:hypothetical protein